jgi:hypothetical protein
MLLFLYILNMEFSSYMVMIMKGVIYISMLQYFFLTCLYYMVSKFLQIRMNDSRIIEK